MWDNKILSQELNSRIKVIKWMIYNKIRSYQEVGRIISEYNKNPESVLERVEGSK